MQLLACDGCSATAPETVTPGWFTVVRHEGLRLISDFDLAVGDSPWHFCSPECIVAWGAGKVKLNQGEDEEGASHGTSR